MEARARWAAEYRDARKVRGFERRFIADGGMSSLYQTVSHDAYIAAVQSDPFVNLCFNRDNGRYGIGGKLKRHITGPARRLPA